MKAIEVKNLKKTFTLSAKQRAVKKTKEKLLVAVDGLSFEAEKGEIYGLLGPNGAGKTTTLRMISTLIKPDEGDIFIEGVDLKKSPDECRKKLGFLTSDLKPDEQFTPDYLFGFLSALHGVPGETAAKRKKELFERFGIDKFAQTKIANLSTGMKQKVSIAISLAHDPEIIIFDEPTNGLDVLTAKTVTDFLTELKEQGKCILLSTHIFSLVEKICDRVGIIINGRMVADGSLKELTAEKNIEDLFFDIYKREVGEE